MTQARSHPIDSPSLTKYLKRADSANPDVVLMDIGMPGMNGVEATRIIHAEMPDVCVIGLSMHEDPGIAQDMRKAGAAACLSKSGPSEAIVAAIMADRRAAAQPMIPKELQDE